MAAMGFFGYPADYLLWCGLFGSLLVHTWCFFRFGRARLGRRLALVLGNLLIFCCFVGIAALAAESYLRFCAVGTDSFGLSLPARRWFALHVKLNSQECRDAEWAAEPPPGTRRIAFVGDSFTYGWGIENVADRFPDRIQAAFDRQSPGDVQILNVAKPGWDTGDQIQPVADMIADYGVDEIVLCYVFNDIEKVLPVSEAFDPTKPPEPWFFSPQSSCLLDYLYGIFFVPRAATVRGYHDWVAHGYADEQTWRRHQEELGAIIRRCREGGVKLRAVLLPFLHVGGTEFSAANLHAKVRKFLELNGVETLDLLPCLEGINVEELTVNRRDSHPNAKAHERFAEAIWKAFYRFRE